MQKSILADVVLPISLALIMLGMGLSLVKDDFKRVMKFPKAVVVGLMCQMIVLPLVGLTSFVFKDGTGGTAVFKDSWLGL